MEEKFEISASVYSCEVKLHESLTSSQVTGWSCTYCADAEMFHDSSRENTKTVTRSQLPLTPAYAFTDYWSQGQKTLPCVIVDIATPPTGGLTPFNACVQLSRSSGASTICLLRDFQDKLFIQHPSECLRIEYTWLEKLDEYTTIWWKECQRSMNKDERH